MKHRRQLEPAKRVITRRRTVTKSISAEESLLEQASDKARANELTLSGYVRSLIRRDLELA